jgi:hypothetical protein
MAKPRARATFQSRLALYQLSNSTCVWVPGSEVKVARTSAMRSILLTNGTPLRLAHCLLAIEPGRQGTAAAQQHVEALHQAVADDLPAGGGGVMPSQPRHLPPFGFGQRRVVANEVKLTRMGG